MKAFKYAFLIAVFSVSGVAPAAETAGLVVTHFEQLQNLQVQYFATNGVQKLNPDAANGLRFDAMGRTFDLELESNDRLMSVESLAGLPSGVQLLRGKIRGVADSWARIVLVDGVPGGLVWDGTEMYAIEAPGDSAVSSTQPVIYRLADSYVAPGTMSCGTSTQSENTGAAFNKLVGEIAVAAAQAPGATMQLDLGAIGDASFVAAHGANATTALAMRLSNVDGIFSAQLGIQLQVQVFELFDNVSDPFTTPVDPNTGETESGAFLNELVSYRAGNAAQNSQGLTHLYTGRDLVGSTVGVAYNGTICDSQYGAGLSEGVHGLALDTLIAAHEIGHNFGAPHDGVAGPCAAELGGFLMATSVNQNDQFSDCSIAEMQPIINNANCFVPLPGTDISIAPATPPLVALLGNSATTNFAVRNNGADDAQNVIVDVTIPSLADIVSVSSTVGTCTSGAGTASCQLGTVSGTGTATVVISTLTSSVGVDSFLASVSATVDDANSNNQASVSLTVDPAVDLVLTVPNTVQLALDQSTSVAVSIDNNSVLDANNVVVDITVDVGVSIESANWSGAACTVTGQQVDCQASVIGSQSGTSVTLGVTGVSAGVQNYSITVSSDEDDRNPANNSITGSVSVNSPQSQEEDSGGGATGLVTLLFLMLATVARRSRRVRR